MTRNLMMLAAVVLCSCAWRGDTKFTATFTQLPPGPGNNTERWAVDLDAKQITFDTEAPKTLSAAQLKGLESALGELAPASKEFCTVDGEVRIIELSDGQTRYAEGAYACPSNAQGAYHYVESLEKVFTQLRAAAP